MPAWTQAEQAKQRLRPQAPRYLNYDCECEVENSAVWSVVQLCSMHRPMFKNKSFDWLVAQMLSGVWPPASPMKKPKDDEVGRVEEGA
jgi:hypothetical protein